MINNRILEKLLPITAEEQAILDGKTTIDRSLYMTGGTDVVNRDKLLEQGKLITIRPHTRFVDFPRHTHDYIEVVYMCSGSTRHVVNGTPLTLQEKRLSQAAFLLQTTKIRVSDISLAVGYENVSYFHRLFVKHFGMAPRAYRLCK